MITGDIYVGGSSKRRGETCTLRCEFEPPPRLHEPPPEFSTRVARAILLATAVGLMYVVVEQSDFSAKQLQISAPSSSLEDSSFHAFISDDVTENGGNKLEIILKEAAMKDEKTVIITTVNAAWTEPGSMFELFLESLHIGNETQKFLDNLVVVALDNVAYSRCSRLHRHCFALTTDGVDFSGEAHFGSDDYLKMMWRRIDFLRSVLEMGYNFIFSDGDIAWMRNPFPRLYRNVDFQIACDIYQHDSSSRLNSPNGGFVYAQSNSRTINFYKYWHAKRDDFPGLHDQDVLNKIKFDSFINDIGLDIRFLDTAYFSGFCQHNRDLDVVVTIHANCCTSLHKKIHDIKMVIQDWNKYLISLKADRSVHRTEWTPPRLCGMSRRVNKSSRV